MDRTKKAVERRFKQQTQGGDGTDAKKARRGVEVGEKEETLEERYGSSREVWVHQSVDGRRRKC